MFFDITFLVSTGKLCIKYDFVLYKEEKMHTDDQMQKISNDMMIHCQVEDADDPSTDMSSCCSMKPFCAAVHCSWQMFIKVSS